jgi:hypothetical protein
MELNVKLQGLKHNFEKVRGCLCKISKRQLFSRFIELFFYWKSHRIGLRNSELESMDPAHGPTVSIKHKPHNSR